MRDVDALVAELRAGLAGVTLGPWYQTGAPWFRSGDGVLAGSPDGNIAYIIADCDNFTCPRDEYEGPFRLGDPERDAAHIARCSPENIAALLDALESERSRADRLKKALKRTKASLQTELERGVITDTLWMNDVPSETIFDALGTALGKEDVSD